MPPMLLLLAAFLTCGAYTSRVVPVRSAGADKQVEIARDGQVALTLRAGVAASVHCADVTGDGLPDLIIESFSGGVHCCNEVRVVDLAGTPRMVFRFDGGVGLQRLKNLDGTHRLEMVLTDDFFDGYAGLCHACSPTALPLVVCAADGGLTDCTRRYPVIVHRAVERFRALLAERRGMSEDYVRGAALGMYAASTIVDDEATALEAVRRAGAAADIMIWLDGQRPAVRAWAANRLRARGGGSAGRSARTVLDEVAVRFAGNERAAARQLLGEAATLAYAEGNLALVIESARRLLRPPLADDGSAFEIMRGLPGLAAEAKDCNALDVAAAEATKMARAVPEYPPDNRSQPPSAEMFRALSREAASFSMALKRAGACRAAGPADRGVGPIVVVAGTYGANCDQAWGNRTSHLAETCDGKDTCSYVIDWRRITDPAVGCEKNYVAEWRCGQNPNVHRITIAPEAGYGKTALLSCAKD